MYGPREVGKTSFMAKGYGLMNAGLDAGFLRSDVKLKGPDVLDFMYDQLVRDRYPDPTNKLGIYDLKLKKGMRTILDFEWVDIIGGSIHKRNSDYRLVEEAAMSADTLMLFHACPSLLSGREEDIESNASDLAALVGVAERRYRRDPDFRLYQVMTKCDLISYRDMDFLEDMMSDVMSHVDVPVNRFFVTCRSGYPGHDPDLVMYSVFLDELYSRIRRGIGNERRTRKTAEIIAKWMASQTHDDSWMGQFYLNTR